MNRRNLLGLLGLGAAAGPSIAKQDMFTSATGSYGLPFPTDSSTQESKMINSELGDIADSLTKMMSDKAKWLIESEIDQFKILQGNPRVDVDIAAMKSFSDIAKLKLQAKRNAEREYNYQHNSLLDRQKHYFRRLNTLTGGLI